MKRQNKSGKTPARRSSGQGITSARLNALIFQPWFVPRETYLSIVKLVPRQYMRRMRDYFNRYGCMKCGSHSRPYRQNGMCRKCHTEVARRLRRCWQRRLKLLTQEARQHETKHLLVNAKTARRLLVDLIDSESRKRATTPLGLG
jgi:hypothetical protein